MGNKNCTKQRYKFHGTELCSTKILPHYTLVVISNVVFGDESNVCIIAMTEC